MDIVSGAWVARRHVASRVRERAERRLGAAFFALLIAAALVRLVLAPLPGYFGDLQLYVTWGTLFDRHILDFYSAGAHVIPQPNYPPLTIYLYGLLTWIAGGWCHLTGGVCTLDVGHAHSLDAFMKLPTLVAELALTGVIYAVARRKHSAWAAVGFAAAYAFSPVVLLDGPLWGQIDALSTLGLVLALLAVARGRGLAAGIIFGLAVMVKPQPVVFAPLILIALWRMADWRAARRGLAGMAGTIVAICLPYLLPPRFELLRFWQDTSQIVQALPNSTLSGFNLWWLAGAQQVRFSDPFIGPLSATLVGWALFAVALTYALVRIWRDPTPRQLWLGAGMVAVAFFVLTTLQHERYLYPAVVLFLVAAIYNRRAWLLYALASLTAFANMAVIIVDPVVSSSGLDLPSGQRYLDQRPAVAAGIAVLNLALLAGSVLALSAARSAASVAAMPASPGAVSADAIAARPASPSAGAGQAGTEGDTARVAATGRGARPGRGGAVRDAAAAADAPRAGRGEGMGEDMKGIAGRLRQLWVWITTAEGRQFCSLLALATLIRVIMLPYRGFFDDVQAFVTWGAFFVHHPLLFYSQGAHLAPVPDYPPLAMYLFGLLVALDMGVHSLFGKPTPLNVNYSHALPALFKLPILLADLALIVAIYVVARRKLSPRAAAGAHRTPLLATATYAFSPVVIFTGVLWGQIDTIFIVLVVLALLAAWKGHGVASGVLFALAVLIKPQPVVFAP
ncbi:MAG TPA: glycosyltransferase 87 family protein, partial [Ktedonobacterales bacterium]